MNDRQQSYVAMASATWDFSPSWTAALTGLASSTPFFQSRFEGYAKLVYNFSTRVREVIP